MREIRKHWIKNKIVKADDLRRIAEVFDTLCLEFVKKHRKKRLTPFYHKKFSITTKDDTEYSSGTIDIILGSILDTKVIKRFQLTFGEYEEDVGISIVLEDSQLGGYLNYIEVEGSDSIWINGTFTKLSDCVDSWESQNLTVKKYKWPISTVLVYLIGLTIVSIISIFSQRLGSPVSSPSTALWPLIGIGGCFVMVEYIESLWPDIEIVPTPEHEQTLQNRRKRIKSFLTGIVVPLIIALVVSYILG